MTDTERIAAIVDRCRRAGYPPALVTAIERYLQGQDDLQAVEQGWLAARPPQGTMPHGTFLGTEYFRRFRGRDTVVSLDELDRHVLDLCIATHQLGEFFSSSLGNGPMEQVDNYLEAHGVDTPTRLRAMCVGSMLEFESWNPPAHRWRRAGTYWPMQSDRRVQVLHAASLGLLSHPSHPSSLGLRILAYMPEHFDVLVQAFSRPIDLVRLLLKARPPYVEHAWQIAQRIPPGENAAGMCAEELLRVAPHRFTAWAVKIVQSPDHYGEAAAVIALFALMRQDPARHIDMAAGFARRGTGWLQRAGAQAAYDYDPHKYVEFEAQRLVQSEFCLNEDVESLAPGALEIVLPALQHCITAPRSDARIAALQDLRDRHWDGLPAYLATLLQHKLKVIRDLAIDALPAEGEAALDHVAPLLADRAAAIRLAAAQVVARIDGARAHALLAARREVERTQTVKAVIDAALATAPAEHGAPAAGPQQALIAAAEAAPPASTKQAPSWFDVSRAPALHWITGQPLGPTAARFLLSRQAAWKGPQLAEAVRPLLAVIERTTSADFGLALFDAWLARGAAAKEAWCMPLAAALGGDRLVPVLRKQIDAWAKSPRRALAGRAVTALGVIGSDAALLTIDDLAQRGKAATVRQYARAEFHAAAQRLQITPDELSDRLAPGLGFDARGARVFDYGPRQFVARLRGDLTLELCDAAGKTLKALPDPRQSDDAEKAAAALAAWKALKPQLKDAAKLQIAKLEQALVAQRAWPVAAWRALFLDHPLRRALAATLVWGMRGTGGCTLHFRPLPDGTLTNAADEAVALPAEGQVCLVHPIELENATRTAWQQHLADYEVTPPFPQLGRAIVRVADTEREACGWKTCEGYVLNGVALKGRCEKAGWQHGPVMDGGMYHLFSKHFPAAGLQAILEISGLTIGAEREQNATLLRLAFLRGQQVPGHLGNDALLLKLGDVPPLAFSEAAADVQSFAAAGEYVPNR